MGIDKSEIIPEIIYELRERKPKFENELLINKTSVFEYLTGKYSVSKGTLNKWYEDNEELKKIIDETVSYATIVMLEKYKK